jgi:hypothetical protein
MTPYKIRSDMMRIHRAVILAPLLFVVGCAVNDAQESTSETDDSLSITFTPNPPPGGGGPTMPTVVIVSNPSAQATVIGHTCNVLGANGTTTGVSQEGVHCADLAFVQNATGWEVWPVAQALCQTVSNHVEKPCAGIRQNIGLFNPPNPQNPTGQLSGAQHNCGQFGGSPCPAAGRFQNSGGHFQIPVPPLGFCAEVWAAMVNDSIVLPGKTVGPNPHVGSGHMGFCNPP